MKMTLQNLRRELVRVKAKGDPEKIKVVEDEIRYREHDEDIKEIDLRKCL